MHQVTGPPARFRVRGANDSLLQHDQDARRDGQYAGGRHAWRPPDVSHGLLGLLQQTVFHRAQGQIPARPSLPGVADGRPATPIHLHVLLPLTPRRLHNHRLLLSSLCHALLNLHSKGTLL